MKSFRNGENIALEGTTSQNILTYALIQCEKSNELGPVAFSHHYHVLNFPFQTNCTRGKMIWWVQGSGTLIDLTNDFFSVF